MKAINYKYGVNRAQLEAMFNIWHQRGVKIAIAMDSQKTPDYIQKANLLINKLSLLLTGIIVAINKLDSSDNSIKVGRYITKNKSTSDYVKKVIRENLFKK